jgi:hypothetical protein
MVNIFSCVKTCLVCTTNIIIIVLDSGLPLRPERPCKFCLVDQCDNILKCKKQKSVQEKNICKPSWVNIDRIFVCPQCLGPVDPEGHSCGSLKDESGIGLRFPFTDFRFTDFPFNSIHQEEDYITSVRCIDCGDNLCTGICEMVLRT